MPSLIGTYVAENYRQQIVPFSRFGTRKVAWYKVGRADLEDGVKLDMVTLNTIISAKINTVLRIIHLVYAWIFIRTPSLNLETLNPKP